MKLSINTSAANQITVTLDDKSHAFEARHNASQTLLPFILKELANQKHSLEDITSIEVNTGPGSFTGLRVGVSVAQTLGWALKVPVNGKLMETERFIRVNYSIDNNNLLR